MSVFFALNVPVIVIFFGSKNSAVGTDVKKNVRSHTSSSSKRWFHQVTYYAVSQVFFWCISWKLSSVNLQVVQVSCFHFCSCPDLDPIFCWFDFVYCLIGHLPRNATTCSSTVMSSNGTKSFLQFSTNRSQTSCIAASLTFAFH
jgi:hypothetical protein